MKSTKQRTKDLYKSLRKKVKKGCTPQDLLDEAVEDPRYMGIYMIYCAKANKAYIGMSTNIPLRWKNHREDLQKKKHHNEDLQRLFYKYGEKSLRFVVLEYCEEKKLEAREQHYIRRLDKEYCINVEVTCVPSKEVGVDRFNNFRELLGLMNIDYTERKDYFIVAQSEGSLLHYYPDTGRWRQEGKEKLYHSKSGVQFLKNYVLSTKKKKKR